VQLRSGVVRLIHTGWQPVFFVARARLGRWGGQLVVPGKFVVVVSAVVALERLEEGPGSGQMLGKRPGPGKCRGNGDG
jgi:hypothetical protein